MKRRWIALFLAVVLMASMVPGALAATVENDNAAWSGNVLTPGVNSDPVAQAEMLRQLGLFRGTDKGFELDQPLTRAQAAVMLTRLLGGEEEALAEQPGHPFTDVPQWASPYVGWLYEQGLTKGVGDNLYSARRSITFEEYAAMLVRMLWGEEISAPWFAISVEGEPELLGVTTLTRGMAVGLTVRAMTMPSAADQGRTTFQRLWEEGVFSAEALETASYGVLASRYTWDDAGNLDRTVFGVPVARCPEMGFVPVDGTTDQNLGWFLATRKEKSGLTIAQINGRTMQLEASCSAPSKEAIRLELVTDLDTADLPAEGIYVVEVLKDGQDIRYGQIYAWMDAGLTPVCTAESLWGKEKLPPDGVELAPAPASGTVSYDISGAQYTVTAERLTDGSLRISAVQNQDGTAIGTFTVRPKDFDGDGVLEVPSVRDMGDGVLGGTAGAYTVSSGELVQLTDRPVLAVCIYDWRAGYDCLTYTPGVTPVVRGRQTGDEIWSWDWDGTVHCTLASGHGIQLLDLYQKQFLGIAPDGVVWRYVYSSQIFPLEAADLKDIVENNLAFWRERGRLIGLGLDQY